MKNVYIDTGRLTQTSAVAVAMIGEEYMAQTYNHVPNRTFNARSNLSMVFIYVYKKGIYDMFFYCN